MFLMTLQGLLFRVDDCNKSSLQVRRVVRAGLELTPI